MQYIDCHKEKIHIPGSIQSFGHVIGLDEKTKIISFYSTNISELFDISEDILGQTLEYFPDFFFNILESAHYQKIYTKLTEPVKYYDRIVIKRKTFHFTIYKSGPYIFLEFEQTDQQVKEITKSLKFFNMVKENENDHEIWQELIKLLRATIDYDRVMIYQFLEDGSGKVIAEAKDPQMESYHNLYYPESDIPRQARNLYLQNTRRLFSNIFAASIPLIALDGLEIDLTDSEFRSMSPVHAEYLKNSGVRSSFSISLIIDGKLWGLVTCHSSAPKHIDLQDRIYAEILTSLAVSQFAKTLANFESRHSQNLEIKFSGIRKKLASESNIFRSISSTLPEMASLIESDGFAVSDGKHIENYGMVPNSVNWLEQINLHDESDTKLFCSRDLFYNEEEQIQTEPVGVLAVKFNDIHLAWFRNEFIEHINWAGNPTKEFTLQTRNGEQQMVVSPRHSFEVFSEQTRGKCKSWSKADQQSAEKLHEMLTDLTVNYYQKILSLNEELTQLNNELNRFSYTVAHDLTNPLTAIKLNAQLLERKTEANSKEGQILAKIVEQTDHMGYLITKILDVSKLQADSLEIETVDVSQIISRIKDELELKYPNSSDIITLGRVPAVSGDAMLVYQVFSNVLSNAVKYSAKQEKPLISIDAIETGNYVTYMVEDNGIGIAEDELGEIFTLFGRMTNAAEFEGSGVGLVIVKNLMMKMGGSIEVESQENVFTRVILKFKRNWN